jgi:hypothetical protein
MNYDNPGPGEPKKGEFPPNWHRWNFAHKPYITPHRVLDYSENSVTYLYPRSLDVILAHPNPDLSAHEAAELKGSRRADVLFGDGRHVTIGRVIEDETHSAARIVNIYAKAEDGYERQIKINRGTYLEGITVSLLGERALEPYPTQGLMLPHDYNPFEAQWKPELTALLYDLSGQFENIELGKRFDDELLLPFPVRWLRDASGFECDIGGDPAAKGFEVDLHMVKNTDHPSHLPPFPQFTAEVYTPEGDLFLTTTIRGVYAPKTEKVFYECTQNIPSHPQRKVVYVPLTIPHQRIFYAGITTREDDVRRMIWRSVPSMIPARLHYEETEVTS